MKLVINHKKRVGQPSERGRLKYILLKNKWANQEIYETIKKYREANENENMAVQSLWEAAKADLRGLQIRHISRSKKVPKYTIKTWPRGRWKKER